MAYQGTLENRPQRRATDYGPHDDRYHRSSPNSQLSSSPGHWKKYIVHEDLLRKPVNRSNNEHRPYGSPQQRNDDSGYRNYQGESSNFKAANSRKDQMMKRVKQIQNRVMPILKADPQRRAEDEDITWHNKIEQRVLKLETNLDSIQKQMQIQIQKRVLEMQAKWEQKFEDLIRGARQQTDSVQGSSHPEDSDDYYQ